MLAPRISICIISFFLIFIQSNIGFCQHKIDSDIEKTHHNILDLDLEKASQLLNNKNKSTTKLWMHSYLTFIEFLTSPKKKDARKTIQYYDAQIEALDLKDNSSYKSLGIADNLLFKAYTHLYLKEYLWAGTSYIKAQKQFNQLLKLEPDFYANYRFQIIQIMADVWMTENLPFIRRVNDIEEAKNQYQEIVKQCLVDQRVPESFKREIKILSILLFPYLEKNASAIYSACHAYGNHWMDNGPIENFSYVKCATKAQQHQQAKQALISGNKQGFPDRFNQLNLFLGNVYLNELKDSSLIYLNRYIKHQENGQSVAYAWLKKSWSFQISEQKDSLQTALLQIQQKANLLTADDEQAIYEAKYASYWHSGLLKARLLFDGGNFTESIKTLNAIQKDYNKLNEYQKITFHYQNARVNHLMGNYSQAISSYQKVLELGMQDLFYFTAYSYFYLGEAYQVQNNQEEAIKAYEKCLDSSSPIYSTSIHHKAKIALGKL